MKWLNKPLLGTRLDFSNPLTKGLIGFWLFNEGMGDKAYDISGNGNHGTLTGMAFPPSAASGWNPGRKGYGLQFDGTNDYVDAGNGASLNITNEITVSVWAKISSSDSGHRGLITKIATIATSNGYMIVKNAVTNSFTFYTANANTLYGVTSDAGGYNDDRWHNVVGIRKDNRNYLYIDGIEQTTSTASILGISAQNLNIGKYYSDSNDYPFNGTIDEARIWNRALSVPEVQELYINPYGMFL